ncbi:MAG: hypothetical protein QXO75_01455 [Nitrososphaerota archaeon]
MSRKQKFIVRYLLPIVRLHPNENSKIMIRNSRSRPKMAHLGEGLRSCDRCGRVDRINQFICIYHGPHGEKTDLCKKCFEGKKFQALDQRLKKFRVNFEKFKIPRGAQNVKIYFKVFLGPKQEKILEPVEVDLEKCVAIIEAENAPLDGWITYRHKEKEYHRHLDLIHASLVSLDETNRGVVEKRD